MMKLGFWRTLTLIVGVVLVIDALALITSGRFNFGVVLPLLIGAAFIALSLRWQRWQAWLHAGLAWRRKLWALTCVGFGLWLATVAVFFGYIHAGNLTQTAQATNAKAIVILGAGTPNNTPSLALLERLNTGLRWAQANPQALVVVSGGTDFQEKNAEAQIMGDYLRQQGLPAQRIVQEEASTSTHENLVFSQKLLQDQQIQPSDPILVVTSDFHTLRSLKIAQRVGFTQVTMAGAPTPLVVRYNAWLREYFAYISGWLLHEY
jgi:uncharacterized SAM-binding protein YcdF (DUF218 family)